MMAVNGATSDGFSTMVQPVASAGTTLQAIWLIGQFQGVIRPQTPIGSFAIRVAPRGSSNLKVFSTSIMRVRCAVPVPTAPPARMSAARPFPATGLGDVLTALVVFRQDGAQQIQPLLARGAEKD